MTNRQIRAFCYGTAFIMAAIDPWWGIPCGMFMSLMDFATGNTTDVKAGER